MSYIPDNLRQIRVRDKVSRTAFEIYTAFCEYADSETGFTFVSIERIADECGDIRHNSARSYLKELIAAGWLTDTFAEISGRQVKGFSLKSEKTAWLSLSERLQSFDKKIVTDSEVDKKIVNNEAETPEVDKNFVESDKKIVNGDKKFVTPPYNPQEDILNTNQKLNQENKTNLSEVSDEMPRTKTEQVREIFEFWQTELNYPKSKLTEDRITLIKARLNKFTVQEIKNAISGIKYSPHHMGDNDRNTKYNKIEFICRSGSNIERFAEMLPEIVPEPSEEEKAEQQRIAQENWEKQRNANRNFDEKLRNKKLSGRKIPAVESGRGESDFGRGDAEQPFDGHSFPKPQSGGVLFAYPFQNLPGYGGNPSNKLDH